MSSSLISFNLSIKVKIIAIIIPIGISASISDTNASVNKEASKAKSKNTKAYNAANAQIIIVIIMGIIFFYDVHLQTTNIYSTIKSKTLAKKLNFH